MEDIEQTDDLRDSFQRDDDAIQQFAEESSGDVTDDW